MPCTRFFVLLLLLGALLSAGEVRSEEAAAEDGPPEPCRVVRFSSPDDVALEADYCPAGRPGAPVVVLLHMIPPHNDRSNYPPEFRARLVAEGFTVLNLDRRGAGSSEGEPREAYRGSNGRLDVQGARDYLSKIDPASAGAPWACIGASNGSTSCLDHALWSLSRGQGAPSAMVFMTGGKYTENNHKLAGSAVEQMPILFVASPEEGRWTESQEALKVAAWQFKMHSPGDHGTRVFAVNPQAAPDLLEFLRTQLKSMP